jgi:two-component system CheB/CheR fusion protein
MQDGTPGGASPAISQERLLALVQALPQLVWSADPSGGRTWSGPQWRAYTGQTDEQSDGSGWLDAVHPEDRPAVLEALAAAPSSGELHVEHRLRGADGRWRWFQSRAAGRRGEDGSLLEWVGASTDTDAGHGLEERQARLIYELQHRTRNLMAVIKAIAGASQDNTFAEYQARFLSRIDAVACAQGLLSDRGDGQRVTLDAVVRAGADAALARFADRVTLDGPAGVSLRPSKVQLLALAVHELAVNAVTHGALAQPDGRVSVRWSRADGGARLIILEWRESGASLEPGAEPRRGFGRELIEDGLPFQLKAKVAYAFGPEGLTCSITAPIASD